MEGEFAAKTRRGVGQAGEIAPSGVSTERARKECYDTANRATARRAGVLCPGVCGVGLVRLRCRARDGPQRAGCSSAAVARGVAARATAERARTEVVNTSRAGERLQGEVCGGKHAVGTEDSSSAQRLLRCLCRLGPGDLGTRDVPDVSRQHRGDATKLCCPCRSVSINRVHRALRHPQQQHGR
eukprot:ctg_1039.g510